MTPKENNALTNIEKLVDFMESEGPELVPAFLTLLEVCFDSNKHCFQKL